MFGSWYLFKLHIFTRLIIYKGGPSLVHVINFHHSGVTFVFLTRNISTYFSTTLKKRQNKKRRSWYG